MSKYTELFELLSELIDVQIKKYVKLATIGVGPDARLNAALVYEEVNELLESAFLLLHPLEKEHNDETIFLSAFSLVKFYLEQESFRAGAGWLLDSNNIHDTVDERTKTQLAQLKQIGELAEIADFSIRAKPNTQVQNQCEHDSFEIAHRILTLARNIRTTPTMELDEKIPTHAQEILRKNASTRYLQYQEEIDQQYQKCEFYLNNSTLEKRTSVLTKEEALSYQKTHGFQLSSLLERYKTIQPNSRLFSSTHKSYTVATPDQKKSSNYSIPKLSFFFCAATLGTGILIQYLLPYLTNFGQENRNESLTP
jgi:hypothetical protein